MYLTKRKDYIAKTAIMSLFDGDVVKKCKEVHKEKTGEDLVGETIPLAGVVYYHPELNIIAGSMLGGIFLSRAIHWWRYTGCRPFHKSNTPYGDDESSGSSWEEQEGFMTRRELESARKAVATRVKKKQVKEYSTITPAMLDDENTKKRCVLYWQNGTRRVWYRVNEALVVALLLKHIAPERDNADILREVKAKFTDAPIEFPDVDKTADVAPPVPVSKPVIAPKPATDEAKGVTSNSTPEAAAPKPKLVKPQSTPKTNDEKTPPKRNNLKIAIAMAFEFNSDSGQPNENAPMVGNLLTQFVGNARHGKRADYNLKEYDFKDNPAMIVGFGLWYTSIAQKGKYDKKTLPVTAEILHRNALQFLSLPYGELKDWVHRGGCNLNQYLTRIMFKPIIQ